MTTKTREPMLPAEMQNYAADWWNPQTMVEATQMAEVLAKSDLVPKDYRGKPGNVVVAWSLGAPLGLSLLSSLTHIAVINGRPSIWGDAALAIVKAHPLCEYVTEELQNLDKNGRVCDDTVAICSIMRRGDPQPTVRMFTVDDAKKAGLWGKQGPWSQYPKRMLPMRARSWAIRDAFPDALCGMPVAEEVRDITTEVTVHDAPNGGTRTEQLKSRLKPKAEPEPTPEATEPEDGYATFDDYNASISSAVTKADLDDLWKAVVQAFKAERVHQDQCVFLQNAIKARADELKGKKK
jgi:hypothetical protein